MKSALLELPFRLKRVAVTKHRLRLARALVTGSATYRVRQVNLLEVQLLVGRRAARGFGEASPLAEWGGPLDVDPAVEVARIPADAQFDGIADLDRQLPWLQRLPILRFGLESALLDGLARIHDLPLQVLLGAPDREQRVSLPVQFTLGALDRESSLEALLRASDAGYTHAKLKVGVGDPGTELDKIRALVAACPLLTFRLDANGAWQTATALRVLSALSPERVELVEQPVPDSEMDELLEIYDGSGPLIGADESCADRQRIERLIRSGALGAVVIKPSVVGGLLTASALFALARRHRVQVIVSNLMESAVGRSSIAHLAAASASLPGPHGLATGSWFAEDVVSDPDCIERGRLLLRSGPGIGLEPSPGDRR